MPVIEILTLVGTVILLITQLAQIVGTGTCKSDCCEGCLHIEHIEDDKQIHLDISRDVSTD